MSMFFFTLLQANTPGEFDWNMLLLGENHERFLLEVMLRSFIMFCVSLATIRLLGKRGIKQRLFEIVVIITLGSAAGDAMFYKDVGLLPAILVFVMIVIMYKLVSILVVKSKWFETLIEGQPEVLIKDGAFNNEVYKKQWVTQDEFLAELRIKSVSQLGQVRLGYLEDTGELSLYYYSDEEVKYGLPVFPANESNCLIKIADPGMYSCINCGYTIQLEPVQKHNCVVCNECEWVKASDEKRIK